MTRSRRKDRRRKRGRIRTFASVWLIARHCKMRGRAQSHHGRVVDLNRVLPQPADDVVLRAASDPQQRVVDVQRQDIVVQVQSQTVPQTDRHMAEEATAAIVVGQSSPPLEEHHSPGDEAGREEREQPSDQVPSDAMLSPCALAGSGWVAGSRSLFHRCPAAAWSRSVPPRSGTSGGQTTPSATSGSQFVP